MFFWSGLSLCFRILKAQKMGCRWQSSQCYCHSGVESVTATVHKADRGVIVQDKIDETPPLCLCIFHKAFMNTSVSGESWFQRSYRQYQQQKRGKSDLDANPFDS